MYHPTLTLTFHMNLTVNSCCSS